MKKVIFYNSNQVWGGGEKWHFNMAMALKNIGYTTELITNPGSELETKAKENKLKTYSLTTNNLSFLNLFKIIQLYKLLKEVKPDIIFLNLPSDVKMCAPIAKFAGVSKVVYRRGMPNPIRNTLLNKYFYSQVDLIIANSIEIKKTIMQNITTLESRIKIVYNGVTPREIQTKSIREPLILGNLGRLVEQKGQLHLIQVAK
jgi:glycosyltransferase involved in cell wall biosynthesis